MRKIQVSGEMKTIYSIISFNIVIHGEKHNAVTIHYTRLIKTPQTCTIFHGFGSWWCLVSALTIALQLPNY